MAVREDHVREFARSCVRAGLLEGDRLYDEVREAVSSELSVADPGETARAWIAEYRAELERDQRSWPETTDHDRLVAAFADLAARGIVVLQGCDDHWAAKAELDRLAAQGHPARGIAWFTPPDVWHAVDEGMLEVNLWHASTANVAPGDALLDEAVAVLADHGLAARYDEGRIEVSAHWQRRVPPTMVP